jgi:hypothetical protein
VNARACLRQFTENAEVLSETSFRVNQEQFNVSVTGDLVSQLEAVLYAYLYTRSRQVPSVPSATTQRDFVARLSAANVGSGTFESGWVIKTLEPQGVVGAEKNGLTVFAPPEDFKLVKGITAAVGEECAVRIGKEYRHLIPGFYMAFGDASMDEGDAAAPLVRLYWHISSVGAPPLVRAVTLELNRIGVPFRFKSVNDPNLYARADAAVLYLTRRSYAKARGALLKVYGLVKPWLFGDVPMLTKRVGNGVGLAEDPGNDALSFGQHRCQIVAEALMKSYENGDRTTEDRLKTVINSFAGQGFDTERLYLQPGSRDVYLSLERRSRVRAR